MDSNLEKLVNSIAMKASSCRGERNTGFEFLLDTKKNVSTATYIQNKIWAWGHIHFGGSSSKIERAAEVTILLRSKLKS